MTVEFVTTLENPNLQAPHLISYKTAAEDFEFKVFLNTSDTLTLYVGGNSVTAGVATPQLRDGEPHHIAVSWDNTNGDVAFYVDGEFLSSANVSAGHAIDTNGTLIVGQGQATFPQWTHTQAARGTFYDVRIWDEVRSAAEISLNYQHKLDVTPVEAAAMGLVANWQMDGFNGSNEVVDIVSGNNLSIGHASGTGFTASTPVEDLHVAENASTGTSVGFVVPSDPDVTNDIVADGTFLEAGIPGTWQTYTSPASIGAWQVVQNNVELLGNAYHRTPLGGLSIDLNGNSPGAIQQTLSTTAGTQYQIVFALSGEWTGGEAIKDLRVSADGQSTDFSISQPNNWSRTNMLWEHRTMTFTATDASTVLRIESLDGVNSWGAVIGDVQVIEIPQAVSTILNNDPTLNYDAATGKFYRFVASSSEWSTALAGATSSALNGVAGQLVTIRSAYENEVVRNLVDSLGWGGTWLGATDTTSEGNYFWLNGTQDGDQFWSGGATGSATSGDFANFSPGEPYGDGNSPTEDYLIMYTDTGLWDDIEPTSIPGYTIEWDASEVLSNYTFSINDPSSNFEIDTNTGEITVAATSTLDYETATFHDVDVTVTDAAGNSYLETVRIAVDNVAITTVTATGNGSVAAGSTYTLNLSADEDATSWTINWGDGTIETIAGNPSSVTHAYDAQAGGLTFNITAAATDADGTVYNNRLFVPSWSGTDLVHIYQGNDATFTGTMAPLSDGLDDHIEVIQGPNGNLFVSSEISDSVLEYTTNGTLVGTFVAAGSGGLNGAAGMAFGPDGDLYVASYLSNQILRFNGTTGAFEEVVVSSGTGGLNSPLGLNFGPDGQLYVSSRGGNKILRFDPVTKALDATFDGSVGGTTEDFTFGPDGHIYAVDASNARIVRLDATDGTLLSVFVTSGAGGLGYPAGIAFGPDGNLYVGDQVSHTIKMYDGATGAYIDDHVTSGAGGLVQPAYFTFEASQQVSVLSSGGPAQILPAAQSTPEDTTLTFSTANGNAITVDDGTAATDTRLQVFLSVDGFNGTLTLSQTTGLSFPGGSNGSSSMVIWGTEADINAALEGMVFTPNLNYNGPANITVETKLAADLQGLYEFENAGNVGEDTSVGVLQNATAFGTGTAPGPQVVVDGTRGNVLDLGSGIHDDYLNLNSNFGNPANLTMSAWVNADTAYADLFSFDNRVILRVDDANSSNHVTAIYHDGTTYRVVASSQSIAGTGWHHVALTFDDATKTMSLYIDGTLAGQNSFSNGISYLGGNVYIGSNKGNSLFLDGLIDDARIYTRALSAAEIAAIASDNHSAVGTIAVTVTPVNDAPTFASLDGNPTYTEGGSAVVLDANVDVSDAELDSLNSSLGNYSSSSLTIVRNGGVNTQDILSFNDGNGITLSGGNLIKNSQVIATFDTTSTNGQLVISFTDANGEIPTSADVDNILRQITYANSSDAPPASVQLNWTFSDGNSGAQGSGGALMATGSTTVTITAVNDAPVVTAGGTRSIMEGSTAMPFYSASSVVDADNTILSGGTLTASITAGFQTGDELFLTGGGIAGVTMTGNQVRVAGTLIGTWSGGTGGTPLVVSFNGSASVAFVDTLLNVVTYQNVIENPVSGVRTISVVVTDGSGGTSNPATATVSLTAVNDSPIFNNLNGTPTFIEAEVPVILDGDVSVVDPELTAIDDFNGATLRLARNGGANAEDIFSANGTLSALVQGGNLSVGGVTIGTVTTNSGGTLFLTFNSNATNARVNSAMQQIAYSNNSDAPPAAVQIDWTFNDGNSGAQGSGAASAVGGSTTVNITNVNDAPVITMAGGTQTYTENGAPILLDVTTTVTDVDSANFAGGTMTVSVVSGGGTADQLSIRHQGTAAGQIGVSGTDVTYGGTIIGTFTGGNGAATPLVITFNSNATPAAVQALARNIQWSVTGENPTTTQRLIRIVVTDGDGGTSNNGQNLYNVVSVNDAPEFASMNPLSGILEDDVTNSGTLVSQIVDTEVTDPDTGALKGIAIYGVDNTNGTWEYTLNGTNWLSVGSPSLSSALLLGADATTAIRFVPNANYNGVSGNLFLLAWDQTSGTAGTTINTTTPGLRGGSGSLSGGSASTHVPVTAVNDAPTITNNTLTVTEGGSTTITSSDISGSDVDGDPLTYTVSNVTGGQFEDPNNPGTPITSFTDADIAAGDVVFVHDGSETVPSWDLSVNDGTVTVGPQAASGVTLNPINDAPTIGNNTLTVTEGGSTTITASDMSGNDVDGDPLTYTVANVTGGQFEDPNNPGTPITTFTDADIAAGDVVFVHDGSETVPSWDLSVSDGTVTVGPQASGGVTLNRVNDAPVFSNLDDNRTFTIGGSPVVMDLDVTVVDAELTSADDFSGATLAITRNGGANADDQFSFVGNLSSTGEGQPLVLSSVTIGTVSTNSAGTLLITFNSNATNARVNEALRLIAYANGNGTPPASVQLDWTFSDGNTLNAQGSGGALQATGSTTITTVSGNSLVTAVGDNLSTPEDTPLIFDPTANDTDNESDSITVVEFTQPTNGSLVDNGNGTLTYTPTAEYNGTDSFEYVAIDSGAGLQHYWGLDGDAVDEIGTADGAINGTTTVTGSFDQALSFNETSDYVLLPDITYNTDFTISLKFKVDDLSGSSYQYLYSHGVFNAMDSISVYLGETGSIGPNLYTRFLDSNDAAPSITNFDVSSIIGDGQWHTYTLTISADDGLNVYFDGTLKYTDVTRGTDGINPTGAVYLGARQDLDPDRFFGGEMDSVQIYSTALNATQVSDLASAANGATVNLTVNPVNDDPTFTAIADQTIDEDTSTGALAFTVGDVETAAGSLTVSATSSNQTIIPDGNLTLVNLGGGNWTIAAAPAANQNGGQVTITLTVNDGTSSSQATFDVTVTAVNDAPTIGNNTLTVTEGGSTTITSSDISGNDVDGDPLTYTVATVTGGQFEDPNNPGTPITSFTDADIAAGDVVFVHDGSETVPSWDLSVNDGTVTVGPQAASGVTLNPVNDAPVIGNNTLTVTEGGSTTITSSDISGSDVDGDPLTYTVANVTGGQFEDPNNPGTPITSFTDADIANGDVIFVQDGTQTVPSWDLSVSDGTATVGPQASSGVTLITINDAPTVTSLANQTINEDTPSSALAFTIGDEETAAASLTVTATSSNQVIIPDGNLVIGGSGANRTITVTPAANQNGGPVTITLTVSDGVNSTQTTFDVTVTAVNDAPVINASSPLNSIAEDDVNNTGTLISQMVDTEVSDPDGGASLKGMAIIGADTTNGSWEYTLDGTNWLALGSPTLATARLLAADATTRVRFVPNLNFTGPSGLLTYKAWDQTQGAAGSTFNILTTGGSSAFSVGTNGSSVIVNAINDPPAITNNTLTVTEGGSTTITSSDISGNDVDGNPLTYTVSNVTGGQFENPAAPGTPITSFTDADIANGDVVFVHDGSETVPSWDLTINDGTVNVGPTGSSGVTLSPVNDIPVLDLDADNSSGGADPNFITSFIENGGPVSIADADAVLSDSDNAQLTSLTVTLSDIPNGVAEVLAADTTGTSIVAAYDDINGVLTLSGSDTVAHYQQVLRTVTYNNTSEAPDTSARSITFLANDGSGTSNPAITIVTMTAINDAPLSSAVSASGSEDAASISITLSGSDVDGTVDYFKLKFLPANGTLYTNVGLTSAAVANTNYAATAGTLTLYFVPNANWNGVTTFDYNAVDNGGLLSVAAGTATITVSAVNDAPVLTVPAGQTITAGDTVTLSGGNAISVSDLDAGSGDVRVTLSVPHGGLTLASTVGLTFSQGNGSDDPTMTFRGSLAAVNTALDGLTYVHGDNHGGASTINVSVSDLGNTGAPGPLTDSKSIDITINLPGGALIPADGFLQGNYLEIGFGKDGAIGSDAAAPTGFVRDGSQLGVVADADQDGWGTYDGDFVLPGSPVETWGVGVGGATSYNSNIEAQQINGTLSNFVDTATYQSLDWSGSVNSLDVDTTYRVGVDDLYMDVFVTLTNASGSAMSDVYYFRNVDPDNDYEQGGIDTFYTTNTIFSQGNDGSGISYVTATQADGSLLGLMAFGENSRVTYGGFHNIDPSAIYNGTGGLMQSGTSYEDEAVSLAYYISTVNAGESVTLRYRYVFAEAAHAVPVVDLDLDDSSGVVGRNFRTTFTEDGGPVKIADTDLALYDPDSANLTGMTITITNVQDGAAEVLAANTVGTSITANYVGGVLTLSGTDSVANYKQVLASVTYDNTSQNPDATTRQLTVVTTDGTHTSATATTFIAVTPVNDIPVLTVSQLTLNEGETVLLSAANLAATDVDADPTTLQFSVTNVVGGQFEFVIAPGVAITSFTQNDVTSGAVRFVDNGDEFAPSFDVSVSDGLLSTAPSAATINFTNLNDAPTISAISNQTINEDTTLGPLSFTVGDAETAPGSLIVMATSNNQTIIRDAALLIGGSGSNRTITLTPEPNANGGPVTITISVSDGVTTSQTTFTVNVTPVNDNPFQDAIPVVSISEGSGVTLDTGGFSDNDGDSLTYVWDLDNDGIFGEAGEPTGASPTVSWATLESFGIGDQGSYTLRVRASDPFGGTGDGMMLLTVSNTAPTANADGGVGFATTEDTSFVTGNVLTNDTDPATGDLLTVQSVDTTGTRGTVINNGDGTFAYNPNGQFEGLAAGQTAADTFQYTVTDGDGGSSTTTVTITINGVNDAPTISVIADQNIDEETSTGPLAFSVADVDAVTLTVSASSNNTTIIPNGNLTLVDLGGGNWTIEATPALNQNGGPVTITLTVDDGTTTTLTTFDITVNPINDAPTISVITDQTIDEESSTGPLAFSVADVDIEPLTVTAASSNQTIIPDANLTLIDLGSGNWTIEATPAPNQNGGPVTITLTVDDGTTTTLTTFDIIVNPINDAPTQTAIASTTINEGDSVTVDAGTWNDLENDTLSYTWDIDGDGNFGEVGEPSGASATITWGTLQSLGIIDEGNYTFAVRVSDGNGGVTDGTFNVTVNNTPPTANDDAGVGFTTDENTSFTTLDARGNDTDPANGDLPLTVTGIDTTGTLGTVLDNGNGTFTYDPNGKFEGLDAGETATDTFTYQITDGDGGTSTATVIITITGVNDAPTITGVADQSIDEDTTTGPLAFSVADVDVEPLTVTAVSNNQTIIPDANLNLIDLGSGNWTIEATPALNQNGGPVTITLSVFDGTATTTTTFNVTVNPINDAPTISVIADQNIDEETSTGPLPFAVADVDADTLTVTATSDNTTIIPNGNLTLVNLGGGNWTIAATPALNQYGGPVTITLTVDDGTTSTQTSFAVTVNPINDAPVIGDEIFDILENSPNGTLVGTMSVSDVDPTDTHVFSIVAGNTNGAFAIDPVSGNITVANAAALDFETTTLFSLTIQVSDSGSPVISQTATALIRLLDENDNAPVIAPGQTFNILENLATGTPVGTLVASDVDTVGFLQQWSIVGGTGATAFKIDAASGEFSVSDATQLDFETSPSLTLLVTVSDGVNISAIETVTITLQDQNDNAPQIPTGLNFSVSEFATVGTFVGTANATDIDTVGGPLTWSIVSGNSDGVFTINAATGEIQVLDTTRLDYETTPSYTLGVTANDGLNTSAITLISIQVLNENDPPTIHPVGPLTISENLPVGTLIANITSSDPDVGDTRTYAITAGNGSGAFSIDPNSGALRVADAAPLDFETTTNFLLTVTVTDAGGRTDSTAVAIALSDVNETPVSLTLSGHSVPENSAGGTIVGTAQGSDVDAGDFLTYSLTADAGQRFVIDPTTGTIRVNTGADLNFEVTSSHAVTVRATDAGGLSIDRTFNLNILNINEAPIAVDDEFFLRQLETLITRNPGLLANDNDVDGDAIRVELVSGVSNGSLVLNSDGTFTYKPDSTFHGVDSFQYRVNDGSLQSDPVTVTLNVAGVGGQATTDTTTSTVTDDKNNDTNDDDTNDNPSPTLPGPVNSNVSTVSTRFSPGTVLSHEAPIRFESHDARVEIEEITGQLLDLPKSDSHRGLKGGGNPFERFQDLLVHRVTEVQPVYGPTLNVVSYAPLSVDFDGQKYEQSTRGWQETITSFELAVGSTTLVSTSLSVGYVVWLLRGGTLFAGLISSIPSWQAFDPLPIVESFDDSSNDDDLDTLSSIAANS
ncbi:MAG: tandem-95 repeat protein [Planctomycetaceae bacterium]